jgi:hypothetical protein
VHGALPGAAFVRIEGTDERQILSRVPVRAHSAGWPTGGYIEKATGKLQKVRFLACRATVRKRAFSF